MLRDKLKSKRYYLPRRCYGYSISYLHDEYKQAVIDAIKNMNGTEGITGSYSFDEYNNPIKPVAIIELTGGDEVYQEMY